MVLNNVFGDGETVADPEVSSSNPRSSSAVRYSRNTANVFLQGVQAAQCGCGGGGEKVGELHPRLAQKFSCRAFPFFPGSGKNREVCFCS